MESESAMTQNEFLTAEEVKAKLSPLAVDLKRISDRLMAIMEKTEGAGEEHHQACECAVAEADHAEFLLPDFPEEAQTEKDPEEKPGGETSKFSEDEDTLANLPHVLEEFVRHLNTMDKGMTEVVATGREVGELGCEVLRCERALRAFVNCAGSTPCPDPSPHSHGEGKG